MAEWKDRQGKHPYYKQGFADGYNEGIGEALKPQAETAQKSSMPHSNNRRTRGSRHRRPLRPGAESVGGGGDEA